MFGTYLELRKLRWSVELTTPYFCHYSHCNFSNTGCLPKRNEQIPLPLVYYLPNLTTLAKCTKSLKYKSSLICLFCDHRQNVFDNSCGRQMQLRPPSVARGLFIAAVDAARLREMDRFHKTARHAD
jgi:hypothetical protein